MTEVVEMKAEVFVCLENARISLKTEENLDKLAIKELLDRFGESRLPRMVHIYSTSPDEIHISIE